MHYDGVSVSQFLCYVLIRIMQQTNADQANPKSNANCYLHQVGYVIVVVCLFVR